MESSSESSSAAVPTGGNQLDSSISISIVVRKGTKRETLECSIFS
jgi:hypothetical protein